MPVVITGRASPSNRPGLQSPPRRASFAALAALLVVVWIAYLPVLPGGFLWDDDAHVTAPDLRSAHGLARIWLEAYRVDDAGRYVPGAAQQYYPLLHSAFWLEHRLWGDHPLGYHLMNVVLHSLAVCLVYLILRKLNIPGALLATAIFALHPVQVESVAWITEQKNTLSAVFYLSAMLAYLYFDQSRSQLLYITTLALFILGLLSKTVTATLPAALLVVFWWRNGRLSWRRDVLPLSPFFLIGAAAGLFTAWVERSLIGAEGGAFDLIVAQRFLLAGRAVWFYLGKLLCPANLIFIYPRWRLDPQDWLQWLFPLAAVAVTINLYLVRRRWRAPLAGWLFFVGTLFPVLGFFNVYPFLYSFVADHFQYLASLGIFVLVGAGLTLGIARLASPIRWIGNALCLSMLVVLALLTIRQAEMYSDPVTLYRVTIERNPNCWMAYVNLGNALDQAGDLSAAIDCYSRVLQFKPDDAFAHNDLGNALLKAGRVEEAMNHYHQALALQPNYANAHNNLANALIQSGRIQKAIDQYLLALRSKPNYVDAHVNLGAALRKAGRLQAAAEEFRKAIEIEPNCVSAYALLVKVYDQLHRPSDAITAAEHMLTLARAQGQTEAVEQIEQWLANYRAQQDKAADSSGSREPVSPSVPPPER